MASVGCHIVAYAENKVVEAKVYKSKAKRFPAVSS